MRQCVESGLVSGKLMETDSTHVKANASCASECLVEVQEEPGAYWEWPDAYEEEGLAELGCRTGKRRKKRVKQTKRDKRRCHKQVSRTGPEVGHKNALVSQEDRIISLTRPQIQAAVLSQERL